MKKKRCRQNLLRQLINLGGPEAKKEDVIYITAFLFPKKRRNPLSLLSQFSQKETQGIDCSLYYLPYPRLGTLGLKEAFERWT